MTETPTETRTVQQYRHAARRQLRQGQELLSLRTDATYEAYNLLNGAIAGVLAGVTGLSQEQQVERLTEARDRLQQNLTGLPEKVAAAKASIIEQIESWESDIQAKADEAVATLEEAREYAATRDFEAHQERKRRGRGYGGYDESVSVDDDEDESDED